MKRWIQFPILALVAAISLGLAFILDAPVHDWMTTHQSPGLRSFMEKVSRYGDWPAHVGLGLLFAGVAWLRGNTKWTRIFLSMLIACALAGTAARVVKIGVGRARPSVQTETVWSGPNLSSKYHAFPSGHTASSTAFFAILLFVNRRIGLALLAIPLLIGFSRMYVAAHYLSDVLCAAILGLICALFVARFILQRIANRKSEIEN
jgi:membrane-associated phospholipid phosphatase